MKKSTVLNGIKEIARRADVSIATVDRVIHKRSGVSSKTRDKINGIISELDYQPNLLARRLALRKTIRLASLIPKVSEETSYWEAPLKGIEQAESEIRQYGIKVEKYFFDQNDKKSFVKQSQLVLKSRPDGVLLAPSFVEEGLAFTAKCREQQIPYVFINSDLPDEHSLCFIGPREYKSGYQAGSLTSYLVNETDRILIVNIVTDFEFILRKEQGFMDYFYEHKKPNKISTLNISKTDPRTIKKTLSKELDKLGNVRVIYVPNARVFMVAHYLKETGRKIILVGHDFLTENISYLQQGYIDFLICQKPFEQSYRGIMALYQCLVLSAPIERVQLMPIDIITRENYSFYRF